MLSTSDSPRGSSGQQRRRWLLAGVCLITLHLPLLGAEEPSLYIVGPNDTLAITVFDQAQLSGKYMVQPDGTFAFPLLGRVKVGGLSVQAIENDVRERLTRGYLKNPQVSVTVDQYRSQQIFVMGEVRQPGSLQFTGAMTIIEALARAGSTTERSGLDAVIIRPPAGVPPPDAPPPDAAVLQRTQDSKDSNLIRVDLKSLQSGVLSQNVTLRAGDTIFVPSAETVIVSGHVSSSGEKVIRRGMTVRQVLALAGGVTERGSTGRIQIIRKIDGQERTIGASLQDVVQPGDTIVVRERFF